MKHSRPASSSFSSTAAGLILLLGVTGLAVAESESHSRMTNAAGLSPAQTQIDARPKYQRFDEIEDRHSGPRCGTHSSEWTPRGTKHDVHIQLERWDDASSHRLRFQSERRGNDSGARELIPSRTSAVKDPFGFGAKDLEARPRAVNPFQGPACDPMDLDGDGSVDIADFEVLVAAFGTAKGDLDRSGIVDGRDLGLMLIRISRTGSDS